MKNLALTEPGVERGERRAQGLRQCCRQLPQGGQSHRFLRCQGDGIRNPTQAPRFLSGVIAPALARIGECDEVAGQIATVHGRDIARLERTQICCVIPVVEVTAILGHARQCGEGRFEPFDGIVQPDPAEIMRARRREKIYTEIGRGGATGQHRHRVFLEIIRWQHIVGSRYEGLEVSPGPARRHPERLRLGLRNPGAAVSRGPLAYPVGDRRRHDPQHRERPSQQPDERLRPRAQDQCRDADHRRPSHSPIVACDAEPRGIGRLRCRNPLQQQPA